MNQFDTVRVAIVYDWLTERYGGAELVLESLIELFPEAPIFTSIHNPRRTDWLAKRKVHRSFLQKIPFSQNYSRALIPLMPLAFESLDLSEYDLIISMSSAAAKGIITRPDQLHIEYLLTAPRFLYSHEKSYGNWNPVWQLVKMYLKRWDKLAGQRPDKIIAISKKISKRGKNIYGKKADRVIYPPFRPLTAKKDTKSKTEYFLLVSRLVKYKQIELSIKAAQKAHKTLYIVGEGREKTELLELIQELDAENSVYLLGSVSREKLASLYKNAQAILMPQEEDFGIVGLEAASLGTPTITFSKSGIAEVLRDKKEALHVQLSSVASFAKELSSFSKKAYDSQSLAKRAESYTKKQWKTRFYKTIKGYYEDFQS